MTKIKKLTNNFNQNFCISKKIKLFFIPLIIISYTIFFVSYYSIYTNRVIELANDELSQKTIILKKDFDYKLFYYRNIFDKFTSDPLLIDNILKFNNENNTPVEYFDIYVTVKRVIDINDIDKVSTLKIYLFNEDLMYDNMYINSIANSPVYKYINKMNIEYGKVYWRKGEDNSLNGFGNILCIYKGIYDKNNNCIGLFLMEVNLKVFEDLLSNIDLGNKGWYKYEFTDGDIILSKYSNISKNNNTYNNINFNINMENNSNLRISFSQDIIIKMMKDQKLTFVILLFIFICLSILLVNLFSKLIEKRIKLLLGKIGSINRTNSNLLKINGKDEFALIDASFNSMIERIKVNEINYKNAEIEKKNMQIELLQYQINPHFLYNTLSAIRWCVLKNNDYKSAETIDNLVTFYRAILSKGSTIISIEQEIKIINAYIKIQQFTYDYKFDVCFNIDEDILHYQTIKLILQPLIENSIIHALSIKHGEGKLIINGYLRNNNIYFEIIDNGIGMEEEKVNKLNKSLKKFDREGMGFGIFNVYQRIKLYFGEEADLYFESNLGIGTKATIKFKIKNEGSIDGLYT